MYQIFLLGLHEGQLNKFWELSDEKPEQQRQLQQQEKINYKCRSCRYKSYL